VVIVDIPNCTMCNHCYYTVITCFSRTRESFTLYWASVSVMPTVVLYWHLMMWLWKVS